MRMHFPLPLMLVLGLTVTAQPATIAVKTTIQAAVDAAKPGDTIVVPPGIYRENVTVSKDNLTIVGSVAAVLDRKSTRLNSSHRCISYAVFCLKKTTTSYT